MILALESSCDETAAAVFDPARGLTHELVHSQMVLHERYGGVVPDLATREHLRNFPLLLQQLRARGALEGVTEVAVTCGPGLAGCLAIGVAAAKALALDLGVPLTGVSHLRGHAWSPFIAEHAAAPAAFAARLEPLLPHLGLIVSGGNTLLCRIARDRTIALLATTRDDAAGEALDKGAKLLGLGYPGGPLIEARAAAGHADAHRFPRGLSPDDGLAFSFSGLKTSLRYLVEKLSTDEVAARRDDLCASYQQAVIDALAAKTAAALAEGGYASVGLSGGVANNRTLRTVLAERARARGAAFLAAQPGHTGDNAGMIAFAAWCDPAGCNRRDQLALRIQPDLALA
ncbi:MAG TPA: tRNA (adenosine(37)-N6)-threonylcarbamoyltransferase complex transferase subunit TsaD [Opitutaceae bacterium]|nr:tRNA (adenosine(37)-N6)-threonylcarbamoyltransferase complex transferase subunit TsaD [Opitutaceae bacterium]